MSAFADLKGFAQAIGAALLTTPKADLHTVLTPVIGCDNIAALIPGTVVVTTSYEWGAMDSTPYDKLNETALLTVYILLGDNNALELGDRMCFCFDYFDDDCCERAEDSAGNLHPYCFIVNLPIALRVTNDADKFGINLIPTPDPKPQRKLAFL